MRRAQQMALAHRPYAHSLADMLTDVILSASGGDEDSALHPFLAEREIKTHGLVLIGWSLPQRITISAAQTELARQLFASATSSASAPAPSRAA